MKDLMSSMMRQEKNQSLFKKEVLLRLWITKGSGRNPDELNKMLIEWEKAKKEKTKWKKMIKNKNPFG